MIVRDPARAPDLPGGEVVVATLRRSGALAAALDPGDRVFMVSMHAPVDERLALHRSFVEVAVRRGVDRVVYISYVSAGRRRGVRPRTLAREHRGDAARLGAGLERGPKRDVQR